MEHQQQYPSSSSAYAVPLAPRGANVMPPPAAANRVQMKPLYSHNSQYQEQQQSSSYQHAPPQQGYGGADTTAAIIGASEDRLLARKAMALRTVGQHRPQQQQQQDSFASPTRPLEQLAVQSVGSFVSSAKYDALLGGGSNRSNTTSQRQQRSESASSSRPHYFAPVVTAADKEKTRRSLLGGSSPTHSNTAGASSHFGDTNPLAQDGDDGKSDVGSVFAATASTTADGLDGNFSMHSNCQQYPAGGADHHHHHHLEGDVSVQLSDLSGEISIVEDRLTLMDDAMKMEALHPAEFGPMAPSSAGGTAGAQSFRAAGGYPSVASAAAMGNTRVRERIATLEEAASSQRRRNKASPASTKSVNVSIDDLYMGGDAGTNANNLSTTGDAAMMMMTALPPIILVVSIEVTAGSKDDVVIRDGDSCSNLALDFIKRHKLVVDEVWGPLTQFLQRNLDDHLAAKAQSQQTAAAVLDTPQHSSALRGGGGTTEKSARDRASSHGRGSSPVRSNDSFRKRSSASRLAVESDLVGEESTHREAGKRVTHAQLARMSQEDQRVLQHDPELEYQKALEAKAAAQAAAKKNNGAQSKAKWNTSTSAASHNKPEEKKNLSTSTKKEAATPRPLPQRAMTPTRTMMLRKEALEKKQRHSATSGGSARKSQVNTSIATSLPDCPRNVPARYMLPQGATTSGHRDPNEAPPMTAEEEDNERHCTFAPAISAQSRRIATTMAQQQQQQGDGNQDGNGQLLSYNDEITRPQTVHDRLHAAAEKRAQAHQQLQLEDAEKRRRSRSRSVSNHQVGNLQWDRAVPVVRRGEGGERPKPQAVGDRLFAQAERQRQKHETKVKAAVELREKQELEGFSFQPKTNKGVPSAVLSRQRNPYGETPQHGSSTSSSREPTATGNTVQKSSSSMRSEDIELQDHCTFRPTINPGVGSAATNLAMRSNVANRGVVVSSSNQQYSPEVMYPHGGEGSQGATTTSEEPFGSAGRRLFGSRSQSSRGNSPYGTAEAASPSPQQPTNGSRTTVNEPSHHQQQRPKTVVERLMEAENNRKEKLERARQHLQSYDPKTGRKLFQPSH